MEGLNTFKRRGVDYETPGKMWTLPRRYYQSEDIYCEELEKIFYRRWLMACREEEIPNSGDYLLVPVGEESIILLRDALGKIYAHFNVCRHRGTRMCTAEKGHFPSGFIGCPYHAWQYELNGNLRSAPLMKRSPGFDKADYPLFSAKVALWGGFVFVNLSEDAVPFEEEMGALINRFQDWKLPELRIAHKIPYTLHCNWKVLLQNYQECYHCPGVHPGLSQLTPFQSAAHDCFDGAVIGGFMEIREKGGSLTMDGKAAGPPVCNVQGDDLQRVYYYSVFPNLLLSPHPDFVLYHRLRPLSFDKVRNDCFFLLHPDVINDPNSMKRFQSAIEFWDITNREDWQVCEQMQQGLRSHRFTHGIYSPQEDIPYALDREVLRALGHKAPD